VVVSDDRYRTGGSNKPGNGGLGEFGWHGARRQGSSFDYDHAWTIDGRTCGHVGVGRAAVVDPPGVVDGIGRLTIDVFLKDNHVKTARPMVRVRYRYRIHPHAVRAAIGVTELCGGGRCGWRGRAFVKEPKLQAAVTGAVVSHATCSSIRARLASGRGSTRGVKRDSVTTPSARSCVSKGRRCVRSTCA
jgi:hypothetical protein